MSLDIVRELVTGGDRGTVTSAASLRAHLASTETRGDTVERAALAGLAGASVGWAFAGGYEAALTRLDPAATRGGALASLCASEEGGAHPRAIRAALAPAAAGWTLSGRKQWVTLGRDAEALLVVASTGTDAAGRNALRVARVPSRREGVTIAPGASTPFAPEIGHARVTFDAVAIAEGELLEGDGYDAIVKPFRTIEDVHVTAAIVGWVIGVACASGWERAWIDEAAAAVVLLRAVGAAPPSTPETHVALAGALACARRLLDGAPWSLADESTRACWERDRPLLDVASSARAARLEAAWRRLGSEQPRG